MSETATTYKPGRAARRWRRASAAVTPSFVARLATAAAADDVPVGEDPAASPPVPRRASARTPRQDFLNSPTPGARQ